VGLDDRRRNDLEEGLAIRSVQDVAEQMGEMKGAIMKVGQFLSILADGLPEEAQAALTVLQADAPPMAPSLAEQVVAEELGDHPKKIFLSWDPVPVAAASIGQVHRAVLEDGREVAVKVQYPGIGDTIGHDLANAEGLYRLFSMIALHSLDVEAIVDELKDRLIEELDYGLEARRQADFAHLYAGHPFITVPATVPELCTERLMTSEWVDGLSFDDFYAQSTQAERNRAGETIFRFAQQSVHLHRMCNGDPHPGNYRFAPDGSVAFLDFGLVKKFAASDWEGLVPVLDAVVDQNDARIVSAMVSAGFLSVDHGLDPSRIVEFVGRPYEPFWTDDFTYERSWVSSTLASLLEVGGPHADVMATLDMPPSFVILDRVVWGVSAVLGRLHARNDFKGILLEYLRGEPPVTELGRAEAEWRAAKA